MNKITEVTQTAFVEGVERLACAAGVLHTVELVTMNNTLVYRIGEQAVGMETDGRYFIEQGETAPA